MVNDKLIFKDSEAAKFAIMTSQQKEIAKLYEDWADEIGERAKFYSHKSNASAPVSERYYKELQKQLRATSQEVSNEIYKKIKSNIYTISDAVVSDNVKWLESFGFSQEGLNAAFSYVPHEVVQNLITGQIYDSGWSLSSRIWGDNEQTLKDIYQVMARGIAENKPIYDIAKDLESYVRPSAMLPWNLRMSDGRKIYKKQVDYNAQRLARTLVQHGYQQSFIATTQKNPFITEYVWVSNGSRVCEICAARDGTHYKKTELPMDHPNGMCTMEPVVDGDISDKLANWFNSPDGTYPEIDEFAGNFGYEAKVVGSVNDFISKYGMSTKSPPSWFNSLTQIQKAEAKMLKEKSGMTWNEWYEKNIYEGEKPITKGKGKSKESVEAGKFSPDMYTENARKAAHKFSSRIEADKFYRPYLDSIWDSETDHEKYSVWEYTHNSNPINKSLSGYHETWERQNFVGVGKADLGYEDLWRRVPPAFSRFGKDGNCDYKSVVQNLTTAIEKSEMQESVFLVRGSDKNGFAGLLEGDLLSFDDAFSLIRNGNQDELKGVLEGQTFISHSFMSTGIASGSGFSGSVSYEIYCPKGTKGIYAEPASYFGDTISSAELYKKGQSYSSVGSEAEIILQRGTQFRISEVKVDGKDLKVKMEVVNQPDYFKTGLEQTIDGGKTQFKK